MTASPDQTVVTVRNTADLLTAVSYRLGFAPTDSLLVVSLDGPRKLMGFMFRVDLPPPGREEAFAQGVLRLIARNRARRVLVFVYGGATQPRADDGSQPFSRLVDGLVSALEETGVACEDVLRVAGGRYWSYRCCDPRCCPSQGVALPAPDEPGSHTEVAAAMTATGHSILPSRADRAALLAPVTFLARAAMESAFARVEPSLMDAMTLDREAARDETIRLAAQAAVRYSDGRSRLDDDEAARLILGLDDKEARDAVACTWGMPDPPDGVEALLTDLVRRAVPPHGRAVATILACVAYCAGDGVIAQTALDRALQADQSYTLALQVGALLGHGLPPDLLGTVLEGTASELRRRAVPLPRRAT